VTGAPESSSRGCPATGRRVRTGRPRRRSTPAAPRRNRGPARCRANGGTPGSPWRAPPHVPCHLDARA
jgi:hypothetical protein